MTEPCERRNKWIGGCSFEPRYNLSEPIFPPTLRRADDVEMFRRKIYVGEVCTRCGRFECPMVICETKVGADSHG